MGVGGSPKLTYTLLHWVRANGDVSDIGQWGPTTVDDIYQSSTWEDRFVILRATPARGRPRYIIGVDLQLVAISDGPPYVLIENATRRYKTIDHAIVTCVIIACRGPSDLDIMFMRRQKFKQAQDERRAHQHLKELIKSSAM